MNALVLLLIASTGYSLEREEHQLRALRGQQACRGCAEPAAGARDDDHFHILAQVQCGEEIQQLQPQGPVDRVEGGGAIECDDGDAACRAIARQRPRRSAASPDHYPR